MRPRLRSARFAVRRIPVSWRFPLRFLAIASVVYAIPTFIEPLGNAVTQLVLFGVPAASNVFGVAAQTHSSGFALFDGGRFSYSVTYGCTGVSAVALFVAAIVAYPSTAGHPISGRQRAAASLVGVVLLMVLNYLRLGLLAWIGVVAPRHFHAAHVYWLQGFTILAVGVGWLAWVRLVVERDRANTGGVVEPLRDLSQLLLRFAVVFMPLVGLGRLLTLDELYGRLINGIAWVAAPFTWGIDLPSPPRLDPALAMYLYASLVAFSSLVVATFGWAGRERLRRAAFAMPILVFAHTLGLLMQFGIDAAAMGGGGASWLVTRALLLPTSIALAPVPLALWFRAVNRAGWQRPRPLAPARRSVATRVPGAAR